jgi:HAD superfamily hydrolase (TIGR01662 family)
VTGGQPTTLVVPTMGRPSLDALLLALVDQQVPVTAPVVLVDDRPSGPPLQLDAKVADALDLTLVRSGGGGPARARNLGWRRARTEWVSFLDDDVVPDPDWYAALLLDLATADAHTSGSQGRVRVPLPEDRRPTDWERGTAGLATAHWITADMSVRRDALAAVGGFDERFPRAFREDADLALRITQRHGRIEHGRRWITHPVRPADDWASLRQQRGNADDFLMRALHGRRWHELVRAPHGRRPRNVATALAGVAAVLAAGTGHRRAAAGAAAGWLTGTAELAWRRIAPGPRDRAEVRRMLLTSVAIPFAATWHSGRGWLAHRHPRPWQGPPDLVLFDRDGTLVHDVPYNGDPDLVRPVDGARAALDRLREAGVRVGMVTNQSGVATHGLTLDDVTAVNAEVARRLGPFEVVEFCPHGRDEGCACRKPAPGMVLDACARLGVRPERCVVVGDIIADVQAAAAAGARGILVPNARTDPREPGRAPTVAASLQAAVDRLLEGRW